MYPYKAAGIATALITFILICLGSPSGSIEIPKNEKKMPEFFSDCDYYKYEPLVVYDGLAAYCMGKDGALEFKNAYIEASSQGKIDMRSACLAESINFDALIDGFAGFTEFKDILTFIPPSEAQQQKLFGKGVLKKDLNRSGKNITKTLTKVTSHFEIAAAKVADCSIQSGCMSGQFISAVEDLKVLRTELQNAIRITDSINIKKSPIAKRLKMFLTSLAADVDFTIKRAADETLCNFA